MSANSNYPASLDLEPWLPGAFQFETPLPGSKSLTLRDCAIAALADGVSTIRYPGEADDYWRMKDCLRRLGLAVDDSREGEVADHRSWRRSSPPGRVELDVGQSAVTTRLMLAFAALRAGGHRCRWPHLHAEASQQGPRGRAGARWAPRWIPPTTAICPTTVTRRRALRGPVRVPGNISSQYLTSLLIIAPLIEGGLTIEVEGDLTSKPYVDLTLDEMAKFGVHVDNEDYRKLVVPQQAYPRRHHRRGRRCLGGVVFRGAGDAAWRNDHAEQSRQRHAPG